MRPLQCPESSSVLFLVLCVYRCTFLSLARLSSFSSHPHLYRWPYSRLNRTVFAYGLCHAHRSGVPYHTDQEQVSPKLPFAFIISVKISHTPSSSNIAGLSLFRAPLRGRFRQWLLRRLADPNAMPMLLHNRNIVCILCSMRQLLTNRWDIGRVSIDILPEDVLLEIFDHYVDPTEIDDGIEAWCTLVQVCRKWRIIVLESPLRLNLRIRYHPAKPMKEKLDIWPTLPIFLAPDENEWN